MPRTRNSDGADTPSRILDTAERLVQRRGYNGFSYADIAAELKITTASLHYHFAGKAALGTALEAEGFRLVTGGTDNHLLLVDLRDFDDELTGKAAQEVLDLAGITLNRNQIPDDPRSPFVTSGLRLGSAAQTSAGMGESEMEEIAALMATCLRGRTDESTLAHVRASVRALCDRFPPYPALSGLGGAATGSGGRGD